MLLLRRRRDRHHLALGVMLIAPFPVLALQPYGGEVLIRIFVITLPAACLLLGDAMAPRRPTASRAWRRRGAGAVVGAGAAVLLVLTRFGNEDFERVAPGDVAAADALLSAAPDGALVLQANAQSLHRHRRVGELSYADLAGDDVETILDQAARAAGPAGRPVFLYLTRPQEAFQELNRSRPDGWLAALADELEQTERVETHYRSGPNAVLEYQSEPSDGPPP